MIVIKFNDNYYRTFINTSNRLKLYEITPFPTGHQLIIPFMSAESSLC